MLSARVVTLSEVETKACRPREQIGAVAISKQMIVLRPMRFTPEPCSNATPSGRFPEAMSRSSLADLQVIAVANLLAGVDVDPNGH
jgi:hypothetical protein